jgi:hypothetical protein
MQMGSSPIMLKTEASAAGIVTDVTLRGFSVKEHKTNR